MKGLAIGLAIAIASSVMVLFTYRGCTAIAQMDAALSRWAKEKNFRIVHKESRVFFRGPFFSLFWNSDPVFYVELEDEEHRRRNAWIRVGRWYGLGFREHVQVVWDE